MCLYSPVTNICTFLSELTIRAARSVPTMAANRCTSYLEYSTVTVMLLSLPASWFWFVACKKNNIIFKYNILGLAAISGGWKASKPIFFGPPLSSSSGKWLLQEYPVMVTDGRENWNIITYTVKPQYSPLSLSAQKVCEKKSPVIEYTKTLF